MLNPCDPVRHEVFEAQLINGIDGRPAGDDDIEESFVECCRKLIELEDFAEDVPDPEINTNIQEFRVEFDEIAAEVWQIADRAQPWHRSTIALMQLDAILKTSPSDPIPGVNP